MNKAVVTHAIPVVPLYAAILFRVMKAHKVKSELYLILGVLCIALIEESSSGFIGWNINETTSDWFGAVTWIS